MAGDSVRKVGKTPTETKKASDDDTCSDERWCHCFWCRSGMWRDNLILKTKTRRPSIDCWTGFFWIQPVTYSHSGFGGIHGWIQAYIVLVFFAWLKLPCAFVARIEGSLSVVNCVHTMQLQQRGGFLCQQALTRQVFQNLTNSCCRGISPVTAASCCLLVNLLLLVMLLTTQTLRLYKSWLPFSSLVTW